MSWEYKDNEFIKLYRKMLRWEWFTDPITCHFFVYCLIKANWKDGSWRGIAYKRGQFITSLNSLSKETGLSLQQVRTAIKHLELTNELTSFPHSNYRLITVLNYDSYQGNQQSKQQGSNNLSNKETNKESTNDQQTANNRYKNNKEYKEDKEEYTAPPESEQNENYEDYEDDEEGFIIPQKDEHGNWINIPEEWKKVGGVVQIRC